VAHQAKLASKPPTPLRANKQRANGMPRYLQLSTLFRRQILSGQWQNGQQIPTVEELSAEFGVARATLRQALGLLEGEGLIERHRAKGTFVTYKQQEMLWCEVETDWSGLLRSRQGATIEVLAEESGQQPPSIFHAIGERARAYRMFKRRHWRGGEPFLLAQVYFEESLAKRIAPKDLETKTALNLLASLRGVKPADVRQTLTIGTADMVTAEALHLPLNAPVAFVQRVAADDSGRLIFVTDGIYRGDVVRLDFKLK
jgi:GntR family transcriptional regulator